MSKVSQYTSASTLLNADTFYVVQSGNSRKATALQVAQLAGNTVNAVAYGADPTGVADSSSAIQTAINQVSTDGAGTVYFPPGTYKVATASGSTVTLPASGSTMPYCVELKGNVKLKGAGRDKVTFTGDWIMRTTAVNTSQKIMFRLTDSPNGGNYYFEDIGFSNCMLPIYHSGIISGYMKDCAFTNCALPFVCQKGERFVWDGVDIGGSGAGIMVGGWLTGTPGSGGVNGGYADKCIFRRISYIRFDAGWTASEISIDTFFNTNFFSNGTNGLANLVSNYRGVVGIPIFIVGRYDTPSTNTEIDTVFSYGAPRPMIFGGPEACWNVKNLFFERVGFTDDTIVTKMSSSNDTWMSNANYPNSANLARLRGGVDIYQSSGLSMFSEIYATNLAATDSVVPILKWQRNTNTNSSANPELTNPTPGAWSGEALTVSYANPDLAALLINATTATNAVGMKYKNTGGGFFTGIDNSTGSRQTGVAYGAYAWLDYAGTLLFGINNTEAARLSATGFILKSLRNQEAQGAVLTAANNLVLGSDGNYFQVNGATQINLIANTNWQGGSMVTLKFNSTPTVKHNQATSGANVKIILNGAVDLVAAANNTLTLRYDSTDVAWYEQSRKV